MKKICHTNPQSKMIRPFTVLLKHFVLRLFNNDIIKYENENKERTLIVLAMLAVAGGFISRQCLAPYFYSALSGATINTIWIDKTAFLTMGMAIAGIFSILNWDNFFLDKIDFINLRVLPIKLRSLYISKFLSLLIFVAILTVAFNGIAVVIFTIFLANLVSTNLIYFGFTHFFTNFLANLFIFLSCACIQSLLTALSQYKLIKKISDFIQVGLLVVFISTFFWIPKLLILLPALKDNLSAFIYYFPPLWFTGIYEGMTGNGDPVFKAHLYIAICFLFVTTFLYLLSFPITFKRFLDKVAEEKSTSPYLNLKMRLNNLFHLLVLRDPIQRGIFYFIQKSLKRSKQHKIQLAMYMAVPLGFILTKLLSLYWEEGINRLKIPGIYLISTPLIIYFFLIIGLRMIIRHPVFLRANWIFKLTESEEKENYLNGIKKALFFIAGLPFFALFFIFFYYFWGFQLATYHSLFAISLFLLLIELFFLNYKSIPFTCEFNPAKPNIKAYWPIYVFCTINFLTFFSYLGFFLLKRPKFYGLYYIVILLIIIYLVWKQNKKVQKEEFHFIYDAESAPVMLSLNIN
jgi:hypothetical protein